MASPFFASHFVGEQARPWWFPWVMSVFSFMLTLRFGHLQADFRRRTRTRWKKQALTVQKQLLIFGGPSLGQGNMPGPDTWAFSFMCLCLAALLFQSASSLAHSLSLAFVHELYSSRLYEFSLTERWKDQRDPVNPLMEWISESLTVFFMMGFARTAWFSGEWLAQHLRFTISGVTAEHYILAYRSKATWRFCWSLQFIRRPILAHGCLGGHHCELHQRERERASKFFLWMFQNYSIDMYKLLKLHWLKISFSLYALGLRHPMSLLFDLTKPPPPQERHWDFRSIDMHNFQSKAASATGRSFHLVINSDNI